MPLIAALGVILSDPEVERILRVDHAGEKGAIQIYAAQRLVSKLFYPELIETLDVMLKDECEHFATFDSLLKRRGIRSCYSLFLWSLGGWLLGFITALLGRRSIGVCTDAIETSVLQHLTWQLDYLESTDIEVFEAVKGIQRAEMEHRDWGRERGKTSPLQKPIYWIVTGSTRLAIWLSTKL